MEINMKPNYIIKLSGLNNPKQILVFNYESTNSIEVVRFSRDIDLDISAKPIARFIVKEKPFFTVPYEVAELALKNNIPALKGKINFVEEIKSGMNTIGICQTKHLLKNWFKELQATAEKLKE